MSSAQFLRGSNTMRLPLSEQECKAIVASLARSFRSLRRAPLLDGVGFDPMQLDAWASGLCLLEERLAAQFILHVWDRFHPWKSGEFEPSHALDSWSDHDRSSYLAWAAAPWWF